MLLATGGTVYDIDIEATKALYQKLPYVWQSSACIVCRMFEKDVIHMPREKLLFLTELGITCLKPTFVWACEPGTTPETQWFTAVYPIVATPITVDENDRWTEVRKGLTMALETDENGPHLRLYWELPWKYKKSRSKRTGHWYYYA